MNKAYEFTYSVDQFEYLMEAYLQEKDYVYVSVKMDDNPISAKDFEVLEGLVTKPWDYEQFLEDYGKNGYQETLLNEIFGPLATLEYIKEEKLIKVTLPNPKVDRARY